jgi:hypothetical protein
MIRHALLTVDFLNNCIFGKGELYSKTSVMPELTERFLSTAVDSFWHSEKDRLDFFVSYSDDTYFCQRRKLKTDFSTGSSYWVTYSFTGASNEQAKQFRDLCADFFGVVREVKNVIVDAKIAEIDDEKIYFEQRWLKKNSEKNTMLELSDWRVLPDIVDSYPGEKDMWIKWRSEMRSNVLKKPSDFDSNLEFFKYSYDMKYPVDPNQYRGLYPDGLLEDGVTQAPEYLDPNDSNQWVGYDLEASTDFLNKRARGIYNLGGMHKQSYKKVRSSILELMKLLQVDDLTTIDWDKYYTENDPNVTFE